MFFSVSQKCVVSFVLFTVSAAGLEGCAARRFNQSQAKGVETGVPLRVVETVPVAGATDVPNNVSIKVYFNKKLAIEGGGNEDSKLELIDTTTGAPVALKDSDVVFEGPFAAWMSKDVLEAGRTYKVRVTDVKSKEDDVQTAPLEFSFTTSSVSYTGTARKDDNDVDALVAAASKDTAGTGDAVYRVQGGPKGDRSKSRFAREGDKVKIHDKSMVFFSMGAGDQANRAEARHRALEFLVNRGENARAPDDLPVMFTFELGRAYGEFLRYVSIPQSKGKEFPTRPQIVDYNQARDQYGVPREMFDDMLSAVVPASIQELPFDNPLWDEFPDMRPKADAILKQAGVK